MQQTVLLESKIDDMIHYDDNDPETTSVEATKTTNLTVKMVRP